MSEELILGIHLIGHDLSISLISNTGEIIFIAEEERYSGIKGGNFIFSPSLILDILSEFGISCERVDHIVIVGEPDKWPLNTHSNLLYNPVSRFHHKTLWEDEILVLFPNVINFHRINHHLAHAACAFYSTKLENACVITMDAYGDNETATIYYAQKNQLSKVFSVPFHHSHVYLYEAFAIWLGLKGKEKAGKLMGLSSYGQPRYVELIRSFFDDNSFFFLSDDFLKQKVSAEYWVTIIEENIGSSNVTVDGFTQFHKDMASSIQFCFENTTLELFKKGQMLVPSKNVCCGGGGFYNSVSNGKLIKSNLFDSYYFHPFAGDSGLSLGAAQLIASELEFKRTCLRNAYLGSTIWSSELDKISLPNYTIKEFKGVKELTADIAVQIADGSIVAWCQSNMEIGPRALGNRSVLADPRNVNNIKRLNEIKRRESWRPFASSVLLEDVSVYFDVDSEFPYMNIVAKVIEPNIIPASCHIDGTARIQTVKYEDNIAFYNLIRGFKEETGVGVLLNTSLNIQGKPIARDINDCLEFFESGQVDIMVINNLIITKKLRSEHSKNDINELQISKTEYELEDVFNLVILSIDQKVNHETQKLVALAKDFKTVKSALAVGLKDKGTSLSGIIKFSTNELLVVKLPWYAEVIDEMMPRLMTEIHQICVKYPKCLLIDIEGKVFLDSFFKQGADNDAKNENLTEVEEYYLNQINIEKQLC